MKQLPILAAALCLSSAPVFAQEKAAAPAAATSAAAHPDTSAWQPLFKADLSDAEFKQGVWTVADGVITASEDESIWTKEQHENYTLDLEFKTADGTNSGVIIYCTDKGNWIPNSLEVQIADDHSKEWSSKPRTWQCAAIFGRLAATKSVVKKPGEWNRMTITCEGKKVTVVLNGEKVTEMDMAKWTEQKTNPDGSEIPSWLSKPAATLPTKGFIGLQGKHAGAPIFYRNVKLKTAK